MSDITLAFLLTGAALIIGLLIAIYIKLLIDLMRD